jgi:hypothetical protein
VAGLLLTPLEDLDLGSPPDPPASVQPRVFGRLIAVPPGLPWEQRRAAVLEARHGAPIPIAGLAWQVRRLERWALGAPARFAAIYAPLAAVRDRLEAEVNVDGEPVKAVFVAPQTQAALRRRTALVGGGSAVAALIIILAVGTALTRRSEVSVSLTEAEALASTKIRAVENEQRRRLATRTLAAAVDRGAPVETMLTDLAWLSAAKAPDARVEAVHWEGGVMALEVRGGDAAPIVSPNGRTLERGAKPLRRGVWLWTLSPPEVVAGYSGPVVAQPVDGQTP